MNTINKLEQPNTEQADRRCAFSRSFTRMFDRLCAFLDERSGGAAELIDACQSVADRIWHSKLYFPVCFLMLAVFMAGGQPVIGGVLVMSTLIFLLLFCDDLLSILFPGVKVGKGSQVKNCILFKNTVVEDGVTLGCVIADKDVHIRRGGTLIGHESYPLAVSKGSIV